MAVSGTTTTTSATEAIYTAVLEDALLHELRPAMFMRGHFKQAPSTVGESLSYDFLLVDPSTSNSPALLYSNTEATAGIDGTAFTVRELQTDKARVTAGLVGIMGATADVTKAVTVVDIRAELTGALSRTLLHKWEVDATANLANFSNTTTAATSQLTADDLLSAIAQLEQRDVTTSYVGGFHPKQLADVRADITGRTGEVWGKPGMPDLQGHYRDSWGSLFGVPLYASTVVSSSGGNYQGAIFADKEALGYLEIWGPKVEIWRDGRALLDYVICSNVYGSVEISDTRGQTVLSSTT
jgi:hypothetical protein